MGYLTLHVWNTFVGLYERSHATVGNYWRILHKSNLNWSFGRLESDFLVHEGLLEQIAMNIMSLHLIEYQGSIWVRHNAGKDATTLREFNLLQNTAVWVQEIEV